MSEGHRNSVESSSVVGITTNKKASPKLNSPNESTPALEYTSNREQKKSEERQVFGEIQRKSTLTFLSGENARRGTTITWPCGKKSCRLQKQCTELTLCVSRFG
jgi:hypothetical protein